MNPFRRHVQLIMDRNTYKKLGNEPNIEKAWNLVRYMVGEELFGRNFVPVPQIDSALYYNQLFVFKKQTCPFVTLGIIAPRYKIVSNLDNLLNIELSTWIPEFDFSPWNPDDALQLSQDFKFFLRSGEDEKLPKSIEISINNAHIRSANPPVLGTTFLKVFSRRAYSRYIITSVVFANYVEIIVCIGQKQSLFVSGHIIPVGFQYKKYKILPNGQINQELPTSLKFSDNQAVWLEPSDSFLLRYPLWDPMRRRHDGSQTNRNIMTLSTRSSTIPSLQRHTPVLFRLPALPPNNDIFVDENDIDPAVRDVRNNHLQLLNARWEVLQDLQIRRGMYGAD